MSFYDAVAAGLVHIQRNRLRAGLSILGILIGVASVLCMMAVDEGTKKIIADDIEKLGGPNQVQFWTRYAIRRRGKLLHYTHKWYTLSDARAIESEIPNVTLMRAYHNQYSEF